MDEVIEVIEQYAKVIQDDDYKGILAQQEALQFYSGIPKVHDFLKSGEKFFKRFKLYVRFSDILTIIGFVTVLIGCTLMLLLPILIGQSVFCLTLGIIVCIIGLLPMFIVSALLLKLHSEKITVVARAEILCKTLKKE